MENYIKFLLHIYSLSVIGISANPMMAPDAVMAEESEFPFVVSLGDTPADQAYHHFCAGTLISSWHVLTAKQCLLRDDGQPTKDLAQVTVTSGSTDMRGGDKYNIVGQPITYEDYLRNIPNLPAGLAQENLRHNLAVITLDRSFNANRAASATLTDFTEQHLHRQRADAVGWGRTEHQMYSPDLHRVSFVVFTGESARELGVTENNLFTLRDFPPGYHGGPIVVGRRLAGVITNGHRSQHASVNYYRNFIEHFGREPAPHYHEYDHNSEYNWPSDEETS